MTRALQCGIALALVALVCAPGAVSAQAGRGRQGKPPEQVRPAGNAPQNRRQAQERQEKQNPRGREFQPGEPGGAPPFLERLRQMSPQDQDRFLNNNRRFRQMTPEAQARFRENLRRWNAMTPEEKRAVMDRQKIWQSMSPEQRRRVREEIMPRWESMDPQRRRAIVRRLSVLRPLSEEEREAKLKDEAFLAGLNAEEREILQTVAKLRLPAPEHGPTTPPPEPPLLDPLIP